MRRFIYFFAVLHLARCVCQSGFELFEGKCSGKYVRIDNITWISAPNTAVEKCKEILGQPIIIHSQQEQSFWEDHSGSATNPVIGLMCNSSSKKWEWADGSALDYKPSAHPSDLDSDCKTGCSWEMHGVGDGWGGSCNNNGYFPVDIFCTTQNKQPVPAADGCDGFEDDSEDGVCYQVGATAESWQDAQMICAKVGGNLASVHSDQENSFIRRLAVSKGAVNGLFLGATTSGKGNNYGWIDGSEWDYSNFHSGFPMPAIGDCVAMDTSSTSGQWINIDCSTKLPVACIRNQTAVTEPVCADGPWSEDKLITSPGFPYNASTPCDYFLTVDVGKQVEVEIVFLEANPCCDFLVIHEGFLGGAMIANITGEVRNVTYTSASNLLRVNWEPNGGVNVRGMAITYRGV